MSQQQKLLQDLIYHELKTLHGFSGKFSTIKAPMIFKVEQEESKNPMQKYQKPYVIKLFNRTDQIKETFKKIRPALKLLYEIFPDQQNVAHMKTDLLQLPQAKFYFVKYEDVGVGLKEVLEKQKYPLEEKKALNYCLQIAKGLAQLQFVGINHRDVKVSNVILVNDEILKVIDFDISKTQRSTQSIKQMTNNKLTYCYSSPWRLLLTKGDSTRTQGTGYRDDAYSFGLLMLQIVFNKTQMQKYLKIFLDAEILLKIKKQTYDDLVKNLIIQYQKRKDQFKSIIINQIIEFSFSLLAFNSDERIDLLAVYKCLKLIELNKSAQLEQFFLDEIELANKRKYKKPIEEEKDSGVQCLSSQDRINYIQYPSIQVQGIQKVERSDARLATLNEKRNKLIIFDYNGQTKKIDITDKTSCGTRVVSTDKAAFILGGEDDTTGNTLTLNLRCKYSDFSLSRQENIPDEGRSSFGVAFSFDMNILPLVGGFMRNSQFAKKVLTFQPGQNKWIQNAKLREIRVSPSCCFTDENFYVFGGMTDSTGSDVKHSDTIQKFKAQSLGSNDGATGQLIVVSENPEFLKFMARTDSLAFHINKDEILVLGGANEDEDDLKEAYRIDFQKKAVTQIQEPLRNAQTSFYSPGICHNSKFYVADQYQDGAQMYLGTFDIECKSLNFEIKANV